MVHYIRLLSTIMVSLTALLINGVPVATTDGLRANESLSTCYCNSSPDWISRSFFPKDCATTISQFFLEELVQWGETPFEFKAMGVHPVTRLPTQSLPRKYIYGKLRSGLIVSTMSSRGPHKAPAPWQ